MKTHVIVNAKAGRNSTAQMWPEISIALRKTGWRLEEHNTRYPGHAKILAARAAAAGAQRVIAVGGDGTVNEVVNGLAGKGVALGIVPTGTGNDFARSVKVSPDPLQAVAQLYTGDEHLIDLGLAGQQYFINACGVGFDAAVADLVNKGFPFITGKAAYLMAVARVFFSFQPQWVTVDVDGEAINKKVLLVAVTNGSYYGGGLKISPKAVVDDGYLDVCIVESLSRVQFAKNFPGIYKGAHISHPKVSLYSGKNISIDSNADVLVQVDGETNHSLPITFRVEKRILPFIMPADAIKDKDNH